MLDSTSNLHVYVDDPSQWCRPIVMTGGAYIYGTGLGEEPHSQLISYFHDCFMHVFPTKILAEAGTVTQDRLRRPLMMRMEQLGLQPAVGVGGNNTAEDVPLPPHQQRQHTRHPIPMHHSEARAADVVISCMAWDSLATCC